VATVLCIDDNQNILELHKALLESNGYKVLIAPDGLAGIALAREHSVNAVVLDFNMPGMDGNQIAEVMMKEQPRLPVIICSGYLDDIPEPLRWFADALLQKADGPAALLSAVEKLVKAATTATKKPARRVLGVTSRLSA
jgi:CheY-like chemotaxis protein